MTDHRALVAQARSVLREWRTLPEDRRAPQVACGLFAALVAALEAVERGIDPHPTARERHVLGPEDGGVCECGEPWPCPEREGRS